MKIKIFLILMGSSIICGCLGSPSRTAQAQATFKNCSNDADLQSQRSAELQNIVTADQDDRKIDPTLIDWNRVIPADEKRAMRIGEIFALGCLKTAEDYAAAALVFQHGTVPDHYYQTYIWSKRAVELGDAHQTQMIANAIDRYLLNSGYKQLFAAQSKWSPNKCHCLEPVETRFSDKLRMQYAHQNLQDRINSVKAENTGNPLCAANPICVRELKDPPKGLFPGIW